MTAAAVGNDAGTAMLKCYTDNCAELDGIVTTNVTTIVTVNAGSSISAGIAAIVGVVAAMMM